MRCSALVRVRVFFFGMAEFLSTNGLVAMTLAPFEKLSTKTLVDVSAGEEQMVMGQQRSALQVL